MKMKIYRCLLYPNEPIVLDLFPGLLQMRKYSGDRASPLATAHQDKWLTLLAIVVMCGIVFAHSPKQHMMQQPSSISVIWACYTKTF